jgi:hypothetical protein
VQAAYYRFLAEGSLEAFDAFTQAVNTAPRTEQCDVRSVQNKEMIVAMMEGDFDRYAEAWVGKWDRHHRGHGNWACPSQINEEANHAHLLLERGDVEQANAIIQRAKDSTTRPYTESSVCIFDRDAFEPKLEYRAVTPPPPGRSSTRPCPRSWATTSSREEWWRDRCSCRPRTWWHRIASTASTAR